MTYGQCVTLPPGYGHRSSNSPFFTPVKNAVIPARVHISAGPEGCRKAVVELHCSPGLSMVEDYNPTHPAWPAHGHGIHRPHSAA